MNNSLLLLNDLFDFDRNFYHFQRDEKDMNPYSIIDKDGKSIIIHNVVGINKDDLKITLKTENGHKTLYITGQTKDPITNNDYSINSRFTVKASAIKNITSECKNGLLYITIEYKEPKEEEITIK